jgi:hypothetical protein
VNLAKITKIHPDRETSKLLKESVPQSWVQPPQQPYPSSSSSPARPVLSPLFSNHPGSNAMSHSAFSSTTPLMKKAHMSSHRSLLVTPTHNSLSYHEASMARAAS